MLMLLTPDLLREGVKAGGGRGEGARRSLVARVSKHSVRDFAALLRMLSAGWFMQGVMCELQEFCAQLRKHSWFSSTSQVSPRLQIAAAQLQYACRDLAHDTRSQDCTRHEQVC